MLSLPSMRRSTNRVMQAVASVTAAAYSRYAVCSGYPRIRSTADG